MNTRWIGSHSWAQMRNGLGVSQARRSNVYGVGDQSALSGESPSAASPFDVGASPPSVDGAPPVVGVPPVAGVPPVVGAPPVLGRPPVVGAPPDPRPPVLVAPPVCPTLPLLPPVLPPSGYGGASPICSSSPHATNTLLEASEMEKAKSVECLLRNPDVPMRWTMN